MRWPQAHDVAAEAGVAGAAADGRWPELELGGPGERLARARHISDGELEHLQPHWPPDRMTLGAAGRSISSGP
ncbi:MAG: hypothetical protein ABSE58_12610, partial [Candidatus Limnocylindrales bacterium]